MAKKKRPKLSELVEKVTPENTHPETDTGPPVGKEKVVRVFYVRVPLTGAKVYRVETTDAESALKLAMGDRGKVVDVYADTDSADWSRAEVREQRL